MNHLSWLLYLGGVSENIQQLFVIFGILCGFATIGLVFGITTSYDEDSRKALKLWLIVAIACVPVFGLTATLMPSKDTVYAIAASQLGEQVLKTPLANKAEQAVETWLDKQIAVNKPAS